MQYYENCVGWPKHDIDALIEMVDGGIDITRRTFRKHVDKSDLECLELELRYATHPSRGLTMAGDYHVGYHRSKLHGKTAYYFTHSCIEYVFIGGTT